MKTIIYYVCTLLIFNILQLSAHPNENQSIGKKALIFGVTGQDGHYLAEFLLSKNYEVHGVSRRYSLPGSSTSLPFDENHLFFHLGDINNYSSVLQLIRDIQPDEIYNLAAQTNVRTSFDAPEETAEINALGPLRILEAVRLLGLEKKIRIFQASSSEIFGLVQESPQTEKTSFHPSSPYGVAKLYGYWITVNYRESYGMFACNGILFNHESPLRGEAFVTRKIILAACRHKLGLQDILYLGNLDTTRDWGFAKDYVEAMWLMLQQDNPEDFVLSTGESHSVRELVELAFQNLDIEIEWRGTGVDECGYNKATGEIIVKIDPKFYRPIEVSSLLGNPEKAEKILHWKPKVSFKELVKMMIEADLKKLKDISRTLNSK